MQRCRSHVVGSTGICGGALDSRASFDPFLAEFSRAAREGRGTRVRAFMRAAGGFGGGTAACDLRGLPPRPPLPLCVRPSATEERSKPVFDIVMWFPTPRIDKAPLFLGKLAGIPDLGYRFLKMSGIFTTSIIYVDFF